MRTPSRWRNRETFQKHGWRANHDSKRRIAAWRCRPACNRSIESKHPLRRFETWRALQEYGPCKLVSKNGIKSASLCEVMRPPGGR